MVNKSEDIFSVKNYSVIVTGASRGIGMAIAQGLNDAGAEVFGVGRSITPENNNKISYNYKQCDVTNTAAFNELCEFIFEKTGGINILVNAAGTSIVEHESIDYLTNFDDTLSINLRAAYSCCKIVSDYMTRSGGGSIINITSINSMMGFPDNPAYVASKGGLRMLAKALAIDYSNRNIRVNCIAPGYIRTVMTKESYNDKEKREHRTKHTILGRWGNPEDLVGATIFLASNASSYITGIDLFVDGGWSAKGISE